jgi:hypothetical protein
LDAYILENNLSSVVAKRGCFLPTSHRLTPHIKAKKCTKKKKLNHAAVDSHAYFFFFLPVLPADFFFFLPFLLLSHFILLADREYGFGRGSVSPGHPLRVNLPLLGFRFNPKTIFVVLGTIFVAL